MKTDQLMGNSYLNWSTLYGQKPMRKWSENVMRGNLRGETQGEVLHEREVTSIYY